MRKNGVSDLGAESDLVSVDGGLRNENNGLFSAETCLLGDGMVAKEKGFSSDLLSKVGRVRNGNGLSSVFVSVSDLFSVGAGFVNEKGIEVVVASEVKVKGGIVGLGVVSATD